MKKLHFGLLAFVFAAFTTLTSCSSSVEDLLKKEDLSISEVDVLLDEYTSTVTEYAVVSKNKKQQLPPGEAQKLEESLLRIELIDEKLKETEMSNIQETRLEKLQEKMATLSIGNLPETLNQLKETMQVLDETTSGN